MAHEKKESDVGDAIFNLGTKFERLNLAYVEYGHLLTEVSDSGFEQGTLIQLLNEEFEHLVTSMYDLRR